MGDEKKKKSPTVIKQFDTVWLYDTFRAILRYKSRRVGAEIAGGL